MGVIYVEDIRCYAYHGCMDEESVLGTNYSVTIIVEADLSKSCKTDSLGDTIDYVSISKVVQSEMAVRSNLIEHVAKRILDKLMNKLPKINHAKVVLTKHNPPINGDVLKVTVELEAGRSA